MWVHTLDSITQQFLIVAATVIFSVGCRTFAQPWLRKIGALSMLVASYLAAWFLTDSHLAGGLAVAAWFFLPWVELLTRIRNLRLPVEKSLHHRMPPGPERFPSLRELTDEIESLGFEYVDDAGWDWEEMNQFFRIFYREDDRVQAAICLNEQQKVGIAYVTITSRDRKGQCWRTWNYPFSQAMPASPQIHLNRVANAVSFEQLLEKHHRFLEENGVQESDVVLDAPEDIQTLMEQEVRTQVDHNLAKGLIALAGKGTFRYSWRGLVYLWAQFVKDMVKLS